MVFKMEQFRIRREMKHQIKAGIPEDELHEFNFSIKDYEQLDWVRPDVEFRIGNEMFDIVRSMTRGDSIQLNCVNDKEEAVLFTQLDELIQKKMEQESNANNSPLSKLVKLSKVFYITCNNKTALKVFEHKTVCYFIHQSNFYFPPNIEIQTPPPDTV